MRCVRCVCASCALCVRAVFVASLPFTTQCGDVAQVGGLCVVCCTVRVCARICVCPSLSLSLSLCLCDLRLCFVCVRFVCYWCRLRSLCGLCGRACERIVSPCGVVRACVLSSSASSVFRFLLLVHFLTGSVVLWTSQLLCVFTQQDQQQQEQQQQQQ